MFKQFDGRIFVGGVIFAVLIIGGIFVYSQWSYNRLADEIGESHPSQTTIEDKNKLTTTEINKNSEIVNANSTDLNQPLPIKETTQNIPTEEMQVSEENTDTSTPTPDFDPTQLLSAFGMPEEITTLLDENHEEGEFERAEEHIKEKFGQSPAVEAIIDRLKQMSAGPVALDDITALFEDWMQVLPEEEQKTRRQLMNALTQLNQIKDLGSEAPPTIISIGLDALGNDELGDGDK